MREKNICVEIRLQFGTHYITNILLRIANVIGNGTRYSFLLINVHFIPLLVFSFWKSCGKGIHGIREIQSKPSNAKSSAVAKSTPENAQSQMAISSFGEESNELSARQTQLSVTDGSGESKKRISKKRFGQNFEIKGLVTYQLQLLI